MSSAAPARSRWVGVTRRNRPPSRGWRRGRSRPRMPLGAPIGPELGPGEGGGSGPGRGVYGGPGRSCLVLSNRRGAGVKRRHDPRERARGRGGNRAGGRRPPPIGPEPAPRRDRGSRGRGSSRVPCQVRNARVRAGAVPRGRGRVLRGTPPGRSIGPGAGAGRGSPAGCPWGPIGPGRSCLVLSGAGGAGPGADRGKGKGGCWAAGWGGGRPGR